MARYTRTPQDKEAPALRRRTNRRVRTDRSGATREISAPEDEGEPETAEQSVAFGTRQRSRTGGHARVSGSGIGLVIFLISLVTPITFYVGPLFMSPYRLFLVIMFFPLLYRWVSGEAGQAGVLDALMVGFAILNAVSLLWVHGTSEIEYAAIGVLEILGGYLAGRVFVRTPDDFDRMVRILGMFMMVFVPAAILESTTGIRVFSIVADKIANTFTWVYTSGDYEKRLGLFRSQSVFEHPILFGVFSSSVFGILYFSNRPTGEGVYGLRKAWTALANTFLSLSTGAFLSILVQLGMILWDRALMVVKSRWKVLLVGVIIAYVVVDLLSNRTPFQVFISYATFSAHNGYMRINIFIYGMENVWAHPLFGIGLNDWQRPQWMHATSVDNFWLLVTMRYGIPSFLFFLAFYIGALLRITRLRFSNKAQENRRLGLILSLIGTGFALTTVHIWGATYVFFIFLLSSGIWMKDFAGENQSRGHSGRPSRKKDKPQRRSQSTRRVLDRAPVPRR